MGYLVVFPLGVVTVYTDNEELKFDCMLCGMICYSVTISVVGRVKILACMFSGEFSRSRIG